MSSPSAFILSRLAFLSSSRYFNLFISFCKRLSFARARFQLCGVAPFALTTMPVVRYCWGCKGKFHGEALLMLSECLECGGELLTAGDWRCHTLEELPAGPSVGLGVIDVDPFTDEPEADKGKGKGKDAGKGKDKDAGKGKDKDAGTACNGLS